MQKSIKSNSGNITGWSNKWTQSRFRKIDFKKIRDLKHWITKLYTKGILDQRFFHLQFTVTTVTLQ